MAYKFTRMAMRVAVVAALAATAVTAVAQAKFEMVCESGLPYKSQTWFYSGAGNELDQSKIKKHWDEGKRITSAAYTENGWFVTMCKGSGYTMQTYHYDRSWPSQWLRDKEKEQYYITSLGVSGSKWFIVLSQGTGYTDQVWFGVENLSASSEKMNEYHAQNYRVTSAVYTGRKWFFVMSQGTKYGAQKCLTGNSYLDVREKIEKAWEQKCVLTAFEYGGGNYVAVMSKYSDGHWPAQWFVGHGHDDLAELISGQWKEGNKISYVGGGIESVNTAGSLASSSTAPKVLNTSNTAVQQRKDGAFPDGQTLYFVTYDKNNKPCGTKTMRFYYDDGDKCANVDVRKQCYELETTSDGWHRYAMYNKNMDMQSAMRGVKQYYKTPVYYGMANGWEWIEVSPDYKTIRTKMSTKNSYSATYARTTKQKHDVVEKNVALARQKAFKSSGSKTPTFVAPIPAPTFDYVTTEDIARKHGDRTVSGSSTSRPVRTYVDKVVYPPSYTGLDNDLRVCPVCGQAGIAHSHVKEPVR